MRRMLEKIMKGYGQDLFAVQGERRTKVRGFLQPVNSKAQRLARTEMGPLGRENGGQFVYIGPACTELFPGDALEVGQKSYHVKHAHMVWQGSEALYCWAMCAEKGGEGEWESNGCATLYQF